MTEAGHRALHVRDYGLQDAEDAVILRKAQEQGHVVVSADSDFAELLARQTASTPSFILFREPDLITADHYAAALLPKLPLLEADLKQGCVAVFRAGRVRIRTLPITLL